MAPATNRGIRDLALEYGREVSLWPDRAKHEVARLVIADPAWSDFFVSEVLGGIPTADVVAAFSEDKWLARETRLGKLAADALTSFGIDKAETEIALYYDDWKVWEREAELDDEADSLNDFRRDQAAEVKPLVQK